MKKLKYFLLILFLFSFAHLYADEKDCKITGKVYDGSSGGVLPDAIIKIENLNKGTAADLDGKFEMNSLSAGQHTVQVSYVGYVTKRISLELKPGEVKNVEIVLDPESTSTDTVTVEAVRTLNNEAGLLLKQQKSENIMDGISEQQIKRTSDASSADVLKRVMGVSIVQDKFIFVRGTSERYSSTTLNGVLLPSTDPDKKSFSFDLFPSNLLDNVVISKSYTPDQIGNFSGGLVQITTKDFPERFSLNLTTSGTYKANTTGENFSTYDAAQSKIFFFNSGFDDGNRYLPSNFPSIPLLNTNFSESEMVSYSREFRNNWTQLRKTAPVNGGFQISAGNKIELGKNVIGVLGAYTYNNSFSTKSVERITYESDNKEESSYKGSISAYNVLWGGILNLGFKQGDNNKFNLKNSYVVSSEDETQYQEGKFIPDVQERKLYSTKFVERDVFSSQLSGEHYVHKIAKLRISWIMSYSQSVRNEPDIKTMRYQRELGTEDPFYASLSTGEANPNGGGRFFSNLKDFNRSLEANLELLPKIIKSINSKLKFGAFYNYGNRYFSARLFAPRLNPSQFMILYQPIDSIFRLENISSDKIVYTELTRRSDTYTASEQLGAGYVMLDIPVGHFRAVFGARLESNLKKIDSYNQSDQPVNKSVNKNDVLPSVNLTYSISDKINLRASYYQSISRPEFREIAPFSFYDFNENVFVIGNPDLERNIIRNYDLRFETFPQAGEVISLSLFYKRFDAPIEEVFIPNSGSFVKIKTFQNAKNGATNYGLEFEIRKNLGFLTKQLKDFSFNGNLALINSKVDLSGIGSTVTKTERRLQGQSPYTINLGLFYDNYSTGTGVNLLYNRYGKRITEAGLEGLPDIEENRRDVVDFTISQKILKIFEVKFAVKDILAQDFLYTQELDGADRIYKKLNAGTSYSLSFSFKY